MKERSLRDRLLYIERTINVYSKEDLIFEIPININLEQLKAIIPYSEEDPEYYAGYKLDKNQVRDFIPYLEREIEINIDDYQYHLVTVGIYDW